MSAAARKSRPPALKGTTYKVKTGCGSLFVTINEADALGWEVFTRMGKAGGCASSQCEALGRLVSLAYRLGGDTDDVYKQLSGITCQQLFPGDDTSPSNSSCADALSKVLKRHQDHAQPAG